MTEHGERAHAALVHRARLGLGASRPLPPQQGPPGPSVLAHRRLQVDRQQPKRMERAARVLVRLARSLADIRVGGHLQLLRQRGVAEVQPRAEAGLPGLQEASRVATDAVVETVFAAAAMELELRARAHRHGPHGGPVGGGDVRARAPGGGRHRAPSLPGPALGPAPPPLPGDAKRHSGPPPASAHRPPDNRGQDPGGGDLCGLGGGGGGVSLRPGRGGRGLAVVPRCVSGAGERPLSTIPVDPLAGGHPSRRRRHDRPHA